MFCVAIYVLTLNGHGPLVSPIAGVPEALAPAALYLFIAAMAFMMVPLTLTVEALSAMTGQATRAATTLERLLDSVSGTVIIATDSKAASRTSTSGLGRRSATRRGGDGADPSMFHAREEIAVTRPTSADPRTTSRRAGDGRGSASGATGSSLQRTGAGG